MFRSLEGGGVSVELLDYIVGPLTVEKEGAVSSLIRRSLVDFDKHESVLVSTFRRLKRLHEAYLQEGCEFWVATLPDHPEACIGCAGLGPFHGLPFSEGVGEIRDLVVEESVRGRGLGKLLLNHVLKGAKKLGYRRLYLETSKSMLVAQKLFESRGFRPVTEMNPQLDLASKNEVSREEDPSYYLLESL